KFLEYLGINNIYKINCYSYLLTVVTSIINTNFIYSTTFGLVNNERVNRFT
ncbi:hypothetical protein GE21DRAFT_1223535, partial [Neurospora crassa]